MKHHQELRAEKISKRFPGVQALRDATLTFTSGEVHALVGENGAGKSTLVKVIAGVHQPDGGQILIDGSPFEILNPRTAATAGISVIHQEFSLFPELSVVQNLFVGMESTRLGGFNLNKREMERRTREILGRFGLQIAINLPVKYFSVAEQQLMEIAKCLLHDSWFIVMDEPTASLSNSEKQTLFEIIRDLRSSGLTIVYISHHLEEIGEIANRVSVLRDGKVVGTYDVDSISRQEITNLMVGKDLEHVFDRTRMESNEAVLELRDLSLDRKFSDVSFSVHAGEVLGLSGLLGFGQADVLTTIFGMQRPDAGEILLDGRPVQFTDPLEAIRSGVMYVPDDRRREGIIRQMNVEENLSLSSLHWLQRLGWINRSTQSSLATDLIQRFAIKVSRPTQRVHNLSGGNQQKVVIGKCLGRTPRLLLLNDPTRGIDVGAKEEIYRIIDGLAGKGVAIVMISSELPEYIGLCDRIIVFRRGKAVKEFPQAEFDQSRILSCMLGVATGETAATREHE